MPRCVNIPWSGLERGGFSLIYASVTKYCVKHILLEQWFSTCGLGHTSLMGAPQFKYDIFFGRVSSSNMIIFEVENHCFRGFGGRCHVPADFCTVANTVVMQSIDWMAEMVPECCYGNNASLY